ncbi:MAG: iron-containing alcohol dehydrogenase [Actinobacteria bacterium]|nr:iron-containing alcohol dehydrogenase [Actinomycetota bacterium]
MPYRMAFNFHLPTRILFGWGTLNKLPEEVSRCGGTRALVVTDKGLAASGLPQRVVDVLEKAGISCALYDGVQPNPTVTMVDEGEEYRARHEADVIIGLGGGSSMDTAKGIGVIAVHGGSIRQYAGVNKVPGPGLPVIAIPTTAGTGSEVSNASALSDPATHTKTPVRSPYILPAVALLDPSLLVTMPQRVAVDTSLDALCHLIEAYVSKAANVWTDLLALEGIRLCGEYLTPFVAERSNKEAAEAMLYAAMLGGIVISYARTGAAHTLTRPIGEGVSHGLACAIVLPYVMEFNLVASPLKFVEIARALGEPVEGFSLASAHKAVDAVSRINRELGVPERLRVVGVRPENVPELAKQAYALDASRLNARELREQDIEDLLRQAV